METIRWENNKLRLLDQTKLPLTEEYIYAEDYQTVGEAIKELRVRGAPAIGVSAAYGLYLGIKNARVKSKHELIELTNKVADELSQTRPTAVNLKWSLNRMLNKLTETNIDDVESLKELLLKEAHKIWEEDIETNKAIGRNGQELIPDGAGILNHCNAGALATAGYGTSLGVIRAAREAGKEVRAYINETRPLLQGARLTTWEMLQENIESYLITDNMAAYLMKQGKVDMVIVGADRIASNGDTANKIGTYGLAILAKHHQIPFYVAAPFSTVDFSLSAGNEIPIEERNEREVTHIKENRIAPEGVKVWNPSFDVTPSELIDAIITEKAVIRAPYNYSLYSYA